MIDVRQGSRGGEVRGAGSSVLTVVTEQSQVFIELRRGRLLRAARRQWKLNTRLARLALGRAFSR